MADRGREAGRATRASGADGDSGHRYSRPIVERLRHYLFVRHGHNWILLVRFGLVGGSGVLVNLLVVVLLNKLGPDEQGIFAGLPLTDFNIRWYHVFATAAFVVANLWNFQLNRLWTFRSNKHAGWLGEYLPFVAVGLLAHLVGLGVLTLLLHPGSWLSLSPTFFDDSSGFRTRLYWAQLIQIVVTTPVSFVLNKLWTFSSVRSRPALPPEPGPIDPATEGSPEAAAAHARHARRP